MQGLVRTIKNRCSEWFKVLQRRGPQHEDRQGSVEALLRFRQMMFRFIVVRPAHIPERIPKKGTWLYEDKLNIAANEGCQPLVSSNFVDRWEREAPFFAKTWKEVDVATSMVYHLADEIRVGVMAMQDDILGGGPNIGLRSKRNPNNGWATLSGDIMVSSTPRIP